MDWIYFALISVLLGSLANIVQRALMKDDQSDPVSFAIVFQFLATIIVGIYALSKGFVLPSPSLYLNLLIGGVLYGIGSIFLFKSLQLLESSEQVIISSSRSLVTIVTAILFLGESFTWVKVLGTFLILASVISVSSAKDKFVLNKGVLYTLALSLCYGLAVTNDAFILRSADPISYTAIMFFLPGVAILLLQPKAIFKMDQVLKGKVLSKLLLISLLYSVAAVSFFIAVGQGALASQIAPINQSQVVVTVLLAALLLKERDNLFRKVVASILVVIGVLLLR